MTRIRSAALAAGVLAFLLPVGCGRDDGRLEVSGTITFKNAPLDNGTVVFVSADGKSQASAVVSNGAYRIPKPQGVAAGKYKVSITSPDGKTPDADPNAPPGPGGNFASKDRIPKQFNTESTLEVEVKVGDPNTFNFSVP